MFKMEDYEVIAELENVTIQEAKLLYAERSKLPKEAFSGPSKTFPSHDSKHVREALFTINNFGDNIEPEIRTQIENSLKVRAKKFGVDTTNQNTSKKEPLEEWFKEAGLE